MSDHDLLGLVDATKKTYKPSQPASKPILAENVLNSELTKKFSGINAFALALGGNRSTIRYHINKGTLYRSQWKIT